MLALGPGTSIRDEFELEVPDVLFLPMEDGDVKNPQDQPLELFRICFPLG